MAGRVSAQLSFLPEAEQPGRRTHLEKTFPGWTRTDPRPWTKLAARWEHTSGWKLDHCGHPTALWPWALYAPSGDMVRMGVKYATPPNAASGRAWPDLAAAMSYVAEVEAGMRPAPVWTPEGPAPSTEGRRPSRAKR